MTSAFMCMHFALLRVKMVSVDGGVESQDGVCQHH